MTTSHSTHFAGLSLGQPGPSGWSVSLPQQPHQHAEFKALARALQAHELHCEQQQEQLSAQLQAACQLTQAQAGELLQLRQQLAHTQQQLAVLSEEAEQQELHAEKELQQVQTDLQEQRAELFTQQGRGLRLQGEMAELQGSLRQEQHATRQAHQQYTQQLAGLRQEQQVLVQQLRQAESAADSLGLGLATLVALLLALAVAAGVLWYRKGRALLREWRELREQPQADAIAPLLAALQPPAESAAAESEPDHAPMLKFANEVSRLEMNLAQMDASTRGHKQLSRGLERIRNNFAALGYELVPLLGRPWQEGLRADADFVADESLPAGERRISAVSRPQVNYKGVMIQKASITVAQNI